MYPTTSTKTVIVDTPDIVLNSPRFLSFRINTKDIKRGSGLRTRITRLALLEVTMLKPALFSTAKSYRVFPMTMCKFTQKVSWVTSMRIFKSHDTHFPNKICPISMYVMWSSRIIRIFLTFSVFSHFCWIEQQSWIMRIFFILTRVKQLRAVNMIMRGNPSVPNWKDNISKLKWI